MDRRPIRSHRRAARNTASHSPHPTMLRASHRHDGDPQRAGRVGIPTRRSLRSCRTASNTYPTRWLHGWTDAPRDIVAADGSIALLRCAARYRPVRTYTSARSSTSSLPEVTPAMVRETGMSGWMPIRWCCRPSGFTTRRAVNSVRQPVGKSMPAMSPFVPAVVASTSSPRC